jgi:hypothetical protein
MGLLGARAGLSDDHLIPPQPHHRVAAVIRRLAALAVVVELPVVPGPESHPAAQAVARFKKLPHLFPPGIDHCRKPNRDGGYPRGLSDGLFRT